MRRKNFGIHTRSNPESGQVMLFTVLGLGLFLIGAMAFAIDMSNMWFHRQSAQTAADAACTAGAMDMLTDQTNNISAAPYPGHFTPGGSPFSCNTTTPNSGTPGTTNPSPCVYAALNGYTSNITNASWKSGTLGNDVEVSSCWATKACSSPAPPPGVSTAQYIEVDVYENMPTFFAGLLNGRSSQSIRAVSKCGVNISAAPIPLIVLDPLNPGSKTSAFNISGTPTVEIYGGPQQSIQVNSSDTSKTEAVTINGSALVDLSQGGPNHTGSSMGITGGPTIPPTCNPSKSGFCSGSTGTWMDPHSPIQDPLRFLTPPTKPSAAAAPTQNIVSGTAGCGAPAGSTCWEFSAGDYPADKKGNSICIGASCSSSTEYATFDPGVYYMEGNFSADDNSCLRISTNAGDGSGGVMFYFVGSSATLSFTANTGSKCPTSTVLFNTTTGGPTGQGVYCDSTAASNGPGNVPATLNGNVLLAPCTGTYGDQNYNSKKGRQRGILFYQDRSGTSVTSTAGGGGSYAMAGTFYFHSCNSSNTSSTCTVPTGSYNTGPYFLDTLQMGGGSGASSYILGEIIVDNLQLQGTPTIYMDLNPSTVNNIYKAALYQ